MSFSVIIKDNATEKEAGFPKLMFSYKYGDIVLFHKPRMGIWVVPGNSFPSHMANWKTVGYYSDDINMHSYRDYHGALTIQNQVE